VLDTLLDDVLRREGIAREAISLLNSARKDQGFEVSDRVRIAWACDDVEVMRALEEHSKLIAREILSSPPGPLEGDSGGSTMMLGEIPVRYSIELDAG
jgi:hypothetical protein